MFLTTQHHERVAIKTADRQDAGVRPPPILPLLVLLPGLDGTGTLFRGFIEALGDQVKTQVVAYPLDEPLGYEELEARVWAFLPKIGRSFCWGSRSQVPSRFGLRRGGRLVCVGSSCVGHSREIRSRGWMDVAVGALPAVEIIAAVAAGLH